MRGEQYYLFIIDKNGESYRVHSNPVTLKKMDERTTKYRSERTLINKILSNATTTLTPDNIEEVIIMRRISKDSDEYKKERGPFYKKDEDVVNEERTLANLELKIHDKKFVEHLLKPYSKIKNFKNLSLEIIELMNSDSNYFPELQELLDKVTKTYKGCRNIYVTMKNYDSKEKPKIPKIDESILPIDDILEDDIIIDELDYLIKYDRELLDIEDFNCHPEMSPFDDDTRRIK